MTQLIKHPKRRGGWAELQFRPPQNAKTGRSGDHGFPPQNANTGRSGDPGYARAAPVARIALVLLLAALFYIFVVRKNLRPPTPTGLVAQCDTTLWAHVYRRQRLRTLNPCIIIAGVLERQIAEQDGDYHLRIRLDPQFEDLLNERNHSAQHGTLVAEVICQNRVVQADAVDACERLDKRWMIPSIGTRVRVTGPYVLDLEHGWTEIHPVNSISAELLAF